MIIREQKDLIVELRQKVAILERELTLIVKNSNEEITRLNNAPVEGGSFSLKPNSPQAMHALEQTDLAKARQIIASQRKDLEDAFRQISVFKQELKKQEAFYEERI
jgi:hypothetical protein